MNAMGTNLKLFLISGFSNTLSEEMVFQLEDWEPLALDVLYKVQRTTDVEDHVRLSVT